MQYFYKASRIGSFIILLVLGVILVPLNFFQPIAYGVDIRSRVAPNAPAEAETRLVRPPQITLSIQINGGYVEERTVRPGATVWEVLTHIQQERSIALLYDGDAHRIAVPGEVLVFNTWYRRIARELDQLPFEVIENHTGSVRYGMSHVQQNGLYGEKISTVSVIYIGGVQYSRNIINREIVLEPVPKIIDVGTAPLGALTDTSAPDFHYVRRIRMNATAYTAGFSCTGRHPWDPWFGITASGRRVEHGIVAVDRNVIPLGTWLYVEGYGFAIAADVGGAIRGYSIDLFMWELHDALQFGRRNVYVYVLE